MNNPYYRYKKKGLRNFCRTLYLNKHIWAIDGHQIRTIAFGQNDMAEMPMKVYSTSQDFENWISALDAV